MNFFSYLDALLIKEGNEKKREDRDNSERNVKRKNCNAIFAKARYITEVILTGFIGKIIKCERYFTQYHRRNLPLFSPP